MVLGIHTILVQTTDMNRSVAFYRDVLELEPGYSSPYWSDFKIGLHKLGIHPVFEGHEPPFVIPFKNAIVGVQVKDISELRTRLENSGDYIRGDYHDTPSGVILDFVDPDGNNWQAIELGTKSSEICKLS